MVEMNALRGYSYALLSTTSSILGLVLSAICSNNLLESYLYKV